MNILTPGDGSNCDENNDVLLQPDQFDTDTCTEITDSHSVSIAVHANPDHVFNPRRDILLKMRTGNDDLLAPFWSEYELPHAMVNA